MNKTHLTRFIIVGLSTNALLLLAFWAAVSSGFPAPIAVTATYAIGLVASLLLNGRWTFGTLKRKTAVGSTVRFTVLYAAGYLYSIFTFGLLSFTNMPHVIDQFFVMASCAGLLFLGQKYWVFKNRNVKQ